MLDEMKEEGSCDACLRHVGEEGGELPEGLSAKGDRVENSEGMPEMGNKPKDIDGLHAPVVYESGAEPEGEGVHEEHQRLRQREDSCVGLRLEEILAGGELAKKETPTHRVF